MTDSIITFSGKFTIRTLLGTLAAMPSLLEFLLRNEKVAVHSLIGIDFYAIPSRFHPHGVCSGSSDTCTGRLIAAVKAINRAPRSIEPFSETRRTNFTPRRFAELNSATLLASERCNRRISDVFVVREENMGCATMVL